MVAPRRFSFSMRFVQPDSNRIGSENRRPTSNGIRDTFAETARDALIVSQRPWVGITTPIHAKVSQVKNDEFVIVTTVSVKNFGPSPALKVIVICTMAGTIEAEQLEQEITSNCNLAEVVTDPSILKTGFTLFPNEVMTRDNNQTVKIEHPEMAFGAVFGGCIVYRDQFDKSIHHTRFCLKSPGSFMWFKNTGT